MLQVIEQDDFARVNIAPEEGIKKSSFSEAINSRRLEQLKIVFERLNRKTSGILPNRHPELGDLVALDGSLINATLSMWKRRFRILANSFSKSTDLKNLCYLHGFTNKPARLPRHIQGKRQKAIGKIFPIMENCIQR